MQEFLRTINCLLWGKPLMILLFLTAAVCMAAGRFAPLRNLRLLHRKQRSCGRHTLSLFQASTTSLAAAMGTGHIIGVATALTLGGAGAVFWMWIAAIFGMALIYAENVLGASFRQNGVCGAMAYLRYGLHSPRLAAFFAISCVAASFGMGNVTQSNAMSQTLYAAFHMPLLLTGCLAAAVTAAVILGGAKRIGRFTQAAVPLLSVLYLVGAGIVIWKCRSQLPEVLSSVFRDAFGLNAVGGGVSGAAVSRAVSVGLRRGVFSNEAGLGSSSVLHGEASIESPAFLGVCGMAEVFVDTFLCCTATALAILCSGAMDGTADGGVLVLEAFRRGLGACADLLLPPVTALFGLCTLIGWSYCGGEAFRYLTGGKYITLYRIVFCIAAAAGAVMKLETVWTLADIANACMAYCNLPGLLLLFPAYAADGNGK
jgi:AGCS family alanine or glycine:cation symporter